eukprot:Em0010g822a
MDDFFYSTWANNPILRHLLVNLRNTSPTAIGRISFPTGFFRAITVAPARYSAISGRALPEANLFITALSADNNEDGKEASEASNKCCTRKPEGPQEVSFGNESRTALMLKSDGNKSTED